MASTLLLLLLGVAFPDDTAKDHQPLPSRYEFAARMNRVQSGMSAKQAREILGDPDEFRPAQRSPIPFAATDTMECWLYGTSGTPSMATLGAVYIDAEARVDSIAGQGSPPPWGMFEEAELRKLLEALGQVSSDMSVWDFNPRPLIRAVNLLQPLGKNRALAAIEEYMRVSPSWKVDNLYLVLRTLFDVPGIKVEIPRMPCFTSHFQELPRFPIVIEGDIPFLLNSTDGIATGAWHPGTHVAFFRRCGTMRERPLAPDAHPFEALKRFSQSPRWIYDGRPHVEDDASARQLLSEQILRLMDTVYRLEPGWMDELLPSGPDKASRRAEIVARATQITMHWDSEDQEFVLANGASLPPAVAKRYRRHTWHPKIDNLDLEVTIERKGPNDVELSLLENYRGGTVRPKALLQIVVPNSPEDPIAELATVVERQLQGTAPTDPPVGASATSSKSISFELWSGIAVRVRVLVGERSYLNVVLSP